MKGNLPGQDTWGGGRCRRMCVYVVRARRNPGSHAALYGVFLISTNKRYQQQAVRRETVKVRPSTVA